MAPETGIPMVMGCLMVSKYCYSFNSDYNWFLNPANSTDAYGDSDGDWLE